MRFTFKEVPKRDTENSQKTIKINKRKYHTIHCDVTPYDWFTIRLGFIYGIKKIVTTYTYIINVYY